MIYSEDYDGDMRVADLWKSVQKLSKIAASNFEKDIDADFDRLQSAAFETDRT